MTTYRNLNAEQIAQGIAGLKTMAATTNALIQNLALASLVQAVEHSNLTPANMLFLNMPEGLRKDALAHWFVKVGNLAINPDRKARKAMPLVFGKVRTVDFAEAEKLMWHKAKPANDGTQELVSVADAVAALIKRMTKASVKDPAVLARLAAAFPEYAKGAPTSIAAPAGQA